MIGASTDPWRPSFGIMRSLQRAGYRVVPVNPTRAGEVLHGETIVSSLAEAGPVDLVSVFRRSDALDAVVSEAIATSAPAIWTQTGVYDEVALDRARASGMSVVADRCISIDLSRLSR